jgi:RNA polymerase sigma factor (sigma-70 family)
MSTPDSGSRSKASFAQTSWTVVSGAGQNVDGELQREALAALCERYWNPVYAFLRQRGQSSHDAEDLTQSFFAHVLEHGTLGRARQEKGRFRSFLLGSLQFFVANERERQSAQKRGGGWQAVSIDDTEFPADAAAALVEQASPEKIFEVQWARVVLDSALVRLQDEWTRQKKGKAFHALVGFLTGQESSYEEAAARLGLSLGATKLAVHRLRRAYGERLRAEVATTTNSPEETEAELKHLHAVLAESPA